MHLTTVITSVSSRYSLFLRSLFSCISQECKPIEIIVVAQSFTDSQKEHLSNLCSRFSFIRPVYLDVLVGSQKARQIGLQHVHSELVHFLDDDDFIFPYFYKKSLLMLSDNKLYCLLSFNACYSKSSFRGPRLKTSTRPFGRVEKGCLYMSNICGPTSGVVINLTSNIDRSFLFNSSVQLRQDYVTWLNISKNNQLYVSESTSYYYNTITSSLVSSKRLFLYAKNVASVWNTRLFLYKKLFFKYFFGALVSDLRFIVLKEYDALTFSLFSLLVFPFRIVFIALIYLIFLGLFMSRSLYAK